MHININKQTNYTTRACKRSRLGHNIFVQTNRRFTRCWVWCIRSCIDLNKKGMEVDLNLGITKKNTRIYLETSKHARWDTTRRDGVRGELGLQGLAVPCQGAKRAAEKRCPCVRRSCYRATWRPRLVPRRPTMFVAQPKARMEA
jgi:hypothetical protein